MKCPVTVHYSDQIETGESAAAHSELTQVTLLVIVLRVPILNVAAQCHQSQLDHCGAVVLMHLYKG